MDENSNFLLTFAPAMVLFGIVIIFLGIRRKRRNLGPVASAMEHFVVSSIAFGILLSILWMSLPSTSSLKTFGYPDDLSNIETKEQMLTLFQSYNKAIVRTTEVLSWFLFVFIWWFLATLVGVMISLKKERS